MHLSSINAIVNFSACAVFLVDDCYAVRCTRGGKQGSLAYSCVCLSSGGGCSDDHQRRVPVL